VQGIDIDGAHISNDLVALNPCVVIDATNGGSVRIRNSMVLGWDGRMGTVAGSGEVMVDNCHFIANGEPPVAPPTFTTTGWAVTGTGNFTLRSCHFRTIQPYLSLGASLVRAVVTGNMCSDTTFNVTNSMTTGIAVVANNTGDGTVYVGKDARLVPITGGAKLQVRNPGTGLWADGDSWTNP